MFNLQQATSIPPNKQMDFVGYALQWTAAIHHHHHIEETAFFPMFGPKFDTSFVEKEHGTFTPGVEKLDAYLVSCLPTGAKYGLGSTVAPHEQQSYDGAQVRSIIDEFAEDMCTHLMQEVDYLQPEKLRASGLTEVEMKAIADESAKHSKELPLTTIVTFACLVSPKEIEFPPFPPFLRKYLVPHVLAFPYRRELVSALAKLMETARGPLPSDAYAAQTWSMAGSHACIINGLHNVYTQAAQIPENKHVDFVGYALQWVANMHHHHEWEEEFYLPMFAPKFDPSLIKQEHEAFTAGFNEMQEYLISCLPTGAKYGYDQIAPEHQQQSFDAQRLLTLIDSFAHELATHLVQEIDYLHPDKLRACGITEEEMNDAATKTMEHMKAMPGTTFLTYVVLLTPPESGFPPAPGFVKNLIVPWVLSWANRQSEQALNYSVPASGAPTSGAPSRTTWRLLLNYTGYAFYEKFGDLKKITLPWKDPQPGEVVVKVKACGVCAGDCFPQYQIMPVPLPRVPGHEFAGEIVAVGADESNFKIGEAVGGGWHGGHCFNCPQCRVGKFVGCTGSFAHGITSNGAYAEYVTVRREAVARIPAGMAPEVAGPLMCAGVTVFNSLRNASITPGEIVAVQGIGGLGHLAIQFAVKMGYRVVALSSGPSKEEISMQLGAFKYLDGSKVNQAEELKKLGGAKVLMLCAPTPDVAPLLDGVAYDGTVLVLAAAAEPSPIPLFGALVPKRLTIRGWPAGATQDLEDCLQFANDFGIKPILQTYPLAKSPEAYAARASAKYRAVVMP
ncbi:hypothetical protein EIP91_012347 [Steccherinum ochraceum]|uniref:Enoyl reductase (ER) domain-containing protein n=1 Tax=Steccherinum ochraceum TaxID=92696 RepID=A0A4R0RJ46_9APHY|nr:hypothetical protein EIP91_012347 [Steccherinum ochraceum]